MKSLLVVVSLLFINDQVTARKSILPEWVRTKDLTFGLPLSVLPIVYLPTVTTGVVLGSPTLAVTGVVCSVVASCGTYYFYNKWRTKVSKKVIGREIEVLTEIDDYQAINYVGHVVESVLVAHF